MDVVSYLYRIRANCLLSIHGGRRKAAVLCFPPCPYATHIKPGSVTKPLPGIEPAIISGDGSEDCAQEGGHLVIRKPWPGLMIGVFQNPEKFKSYFNRFPGNYLTGDGARIDEDGNYWILRPHG